VNRDWELAEKRRLWPGCGFCRWCLGPVPPPKQTFCGPLCVHEWKLRSDPGYLRKCVLKRDGGVCASCGTVAACWEADHVVELAEGGKGGLDNVQTLCSAGRRRSCHYLKTREYARRRAERRRAASRPA
jgi:5-methylcytosine-specific restriction protein A